MSKEIIRAEQSGAVQGEGEVIYQYQKVSLRILFWFIVIMFSAYAQEKILYFLNINISLVLFCIISAIFVLLLINKGYKYVKKPFAREGKCIIDDVQLTFKKTYKNIWIDLKDIKEIFCKINTIYGTRFVALGIVYVTAEKQKSICIYSTDLEQENVLPEDTALWEIYNAVVLRRPALYHKEECEKC